MISNRWSTTKLLVFASRIAFAASFGLFGMLAIEADAQYAPSIQGGGASLPAPTYRQNFNCYGMPLTNPPDPAADTYVPSQCTDVGYPIDSTKIFRYSSVGSGRGQYMYLTGDTSYNNDAARPLSEVNFAGSDAKLTQN